MYNKEQNEMRALELRELGYNPLAKRIACCGERAFYPGYPCLPPCRSRLCPSCAAEIQRRNAEYVKNAVLGFNNPTAYLVTMPPSDDLSAALSVFRRSLYKLRHLRYFQRAVAGGVSAIETKFVGGKWHVHCHLILDHCGEPLDLARVQKDWGRYTKQGRSNWEGQFEYHTDPKVDQWNLDGFAAYITKSDTWCPKPALAEELITRKSLDCLDILHTALKGKHLLITFGTGVLK